MFRSNKPFHPERLWHYLDVDFPSTIIRAKGLFWLASRRNEAINFPQAGDSLRIDYAGVWWASMNYEERMLYPDFIYNQQLI